MSTNAEWTPRRLRLRTPKIAAAIIIAITATAVGPALARSDFLLVHRTHPLQSIRLSAMTPTHIEAAQPTGAGAPLRFSLDQCIALLNPVTSRKPNSMGLLLLANGQRLPGEAIIGGQPLDDAIAWVHPWLGRINVPLESLEAVKFRPNAEVPPQGQNDVVLLANGDRQEGLIVALGSAISMEVERGGAKQVMEIPLNLVAAISLVAPRQTPSGKRLWFEDGTVIDAQTITVSDDGAVQLRGLALNDAATPSRVNLSQIAAILLDPAGMVPLATLEPTRIEGPPTRYVVPRPEVRDPEAPLMLSAIEYSGPIVVRYTVPAGAQRFIADAELPRQSYEWGHYDLVVRSQDAEVFRATLNAAQPAAAINVPLRGRELTIEIVPGENGPIQNQLILHRPMLLMQQ